MLSTTTSFILDGLSARAALIEVDVHRGLPGFAVVGLPDDAARETRERVRAAIVNSGFEFPLRRIVVNVAPASLRRAGPSIDLPIAAALLHASGQLDWPGMERVALVGKLALDGAVRPVDGALAIAEAAREADVLTVVVPVRNGPEAALAGRIEVVPLAGLAGLAALRSGRIPPAPEPLPLPSGPPPGGPDLADLRGQPQVRQALEVAAAGGHGLLLVGEPGSGSSLAASRLPSILPPLNEAEALEVVRIAGAAGTLGAGLPAGRPFRAPHHTISVSGLIGGGTPPRPGEITLAHRGVLFLDELCEFRRNVLQALPAPLEAGEVPIARVGGRRRPPCRFLLVAASNPCPCGRGERDCVCRPLDVRRFRVRMTRGLGHHLPLRVEVRAPTMSDVAGPVVESSATVRGRVMAARERAEARLGRGRTNAGMTPAEVAEIPLTTGAVRLLAAEIARHPMPRPSPHDTLRVARTVADLAGSGSVDAEAMSVAFGLRADEGPEAAA